VHTWDGTNWQPVGGFFNGPVLCLAADGQALLAGGQFTTVDVAPARCVARWNGQQWQALGDGLPLGGQDGWVSAIASQSSAIFAGVTLNPGLSTQAAPARFRDGAWEYLAAPEPSVDFNSGALIPAPFGMLYAGEFAHLDAVQSPHLAIFGPAAPACFADCDCSPTPPVLNATDFACFLTRFAAGDPYANCDGSTVSPVLTVADLACFMNRFAAGCT
jgi:hypothetical protein